MRVRVREQPAEVGPARRVADEQGDVTTVGQRDLAAVDRVQAGGLRRLRELHRAGHRVVVGQRQGGVAPRDRGGDELLGLRRPVEEREGRVAMQLDVGHEHMFASPADGRLATAASLAAMPPAAIAIRPPQPADARAIAGLLGELGYPTTPEQWARRLERLDREPATWLFVAE